MKTNKGNSKKIGYFSQVFKMLHQYLLNNYAVLLVLLGAFLLSGVSAFFVTVSSETVYSFSLSDFEEGQISDRTIIAGTSIPADSDNPIEIKDGEKVIRKGFPITKEAMSKLKRMAEAPAYFDYRVFANKILYLLLLSVFAFLLFSPVLSEKPVTVKECVLLAVFFLMVYVSSCLCNRLPLFSSPYNLPILIPGAFCVLIVTLLFGQIHGIFFSFVLSFGILNADASNLIPSLFVLASCLASNRIVRKIERRIDMVFVALVLALLHIVFIVVLKVIFSSSFTDSIFSILMIALNGFMSGILALGFLTPLESILNTASVFRLMELSDLNNPIMRKMLLTASGTYNHSMMVATLAENACRAIDANPLLARVGAYYHDLGKLDQSEYFVENQTEGNKHNEINPRLSAAVIKSHVKKGVEKAHQLRLPPEVVEIISEHHGNSAISFFYNKAKELDEDAPENEYCYDGNPPSSKESAVVMLADTVEAACRTLKNPSVSRLEKFVHELIMGKFNNRQLDNSELSFRDLAVIEDSFVQILAGYYHSRIEYPNQKDPDESSSPQNAVAGHQLKATDVAKE
ncbi:MAG: HDIG domain-containing protein [Spirochaetaceae bacterium]|nr:HDIG domain-containing protein [Spirochaetaceae bacterium]